MHFLWITWNSDLLKNQFVLVSCMLTVSPMILQKSDYRKFSYKMERDGIWNKAEWRSRCTESRWPAEKQLTPLGGEVAVLCGGSLSITPISHDQINWQSWLEQRLLRIERIHTLSFYFNLRDIRGIYLSMFWC